MQKIVMFGGAFDPVHLGHIDIVQHLLALDFDLILIMPTGKTSLKHLQTDCVHRLKMLGLAFSKEQGLCFDDRIRISDLECHSQTMSYTYHTILQLKQDYPHSEISICVGADQANTLHRWFAYEDLLQLVKFIVIRREGVDLSPCMRAYSVIEEAPIEISSSLLREHLWAGQMDVAKYLPSMVFEYIQENELYRKYSQ